jgi:D-alanine-D-alanine ligase
MSNVAGSDKPLRVAVIEGGPSSEAAVSRLSASGVSAALEAMGHTVVRVPLDRDTATTLLAGRFDVVFPVVHGILGEDGSLQGLLEVLALPYVGSGVLASALACDKISAKRVFRDEGLPVAAQSVVTRLDDLTAAAARVRRDIGPALVVKPRGQGSAIGVSRIEADASDREVIEALSQALALDDAALCERFVRGREVTCGVLDLPARGGARALPPTMIVAKAADWYDFRSRYGTGGSEHLCPAPLPGDVTTRLQELALRAHNALGCRDLSRADFVVGDGADAAAITLLEVNTIPGMTPTSLYPEAARVDGVAMEQLCDGLVRAAVARGIRQGNAAIPLPTI